MRPCLVTVFTGVLLAVFAAPASLGAGSASPVIARILERGQLRVGLSGSQPPFNFESRSGSLVGFDVDLARAIAAMMGIPPQIVQKPFHELLHALEAGQLDLVISGLTVTPGRNMRVAFIGPYHVTGKSVLTRSAELGQANEPADLNSPELKLAALEGSTSQDFARAFLPRAELRLAPSQQAAVRLLLEGEVQAVVADHEVCKLAVLRNPDAGLVVPPKPLTVEPIGIAVAPGDGLFLNLMENLVDALADSDVIAGLQGKWIKSDRWVDHLP